MSEIDDLKSIEKALNDALVEARGEIKRLQKRIEYLESVITQDGGVTRDYFLEVERLRAERQQAKDSATKWFAKAQYWADEVERLREALRPFVLAARAQGPLRPGYYKLRLSGEEVAAADAAIAQPTEGQERNEPPLRKGAVPGRGPVPTTPPPRAHPTEGQDR